ncbi:cytochrome P450 [Streptomyces sp. NL15-2K]|uniref:cytochrome P450 n=1 Tax=Streptomyces sp. NL15-2K TaxID=376149 RepID=UPI000F586814|nr:MULTISPECIES: cytochrome P450 [Actinomycetes]WKX14901.1 cytochrome P450 [Kutzneria buriramensis]
MSVSDPGPERAWTVGTAPGIFPFIGHGIELARRPLAFLNSLSAHGDLVEIRLGPQRAWMACHPDLVHQVLMDPRTFDKGGPLYDRLRMLLGDGVGTCRHQDHRRQRRLLQPDFRKARVADQVELMGEEVESVCREWRAGQEVDISATMLDLSTRVVSRVLFSDSLDAATAAEMRRCLATVVRGMFVRTVMPVDALFRVPTRANRRYRHASDRLRAIVAAAIAERRRDTPTDDRDDVLGTLLAAARGDGEGTAITEQEVHGQVITLLFAGAESTSLCLSSVFDLLARHPEEERRLRSEVDAVLAVGRPPGLDELPRLFHTRCVLTETLRHRPPGWLFTRVTTRETDLAGHRLPQGATVMFSPYLLHHDPALFPDPDRFLPDRWLPGRAAAVPPGAMIPFGGGSRKCIGETLAMAEATVVVAFIARHWGLRHLPGHVERLRPAASLGPRGLVMVCEPRSKRPVGTSSRADSRAPRTTVVPLVHDSRTAGGNDVDDA